MTGWRCLLGRFTARILFCASKLTMSASPSAGGASSFVLGVFLTLLGGLCNGTWTLVTKPNAPAFLNAVRRTSRDNGEGGMDSDDSWAWENAWCAIQTFAPLINAVVCASAAHDAIAYAWRGADGTVAAAVVVCSLLWGAGGVGFGKAVHHLGVATGTSLCMGIILVLGTAIAAVAQTKSIPVASAGLTAASVLAGTLGLAAAARAGLRRDAADTSASKAEGGGGAVWVGLAWAAVGGILSAMLQLAFVASAPVMENAESSGGADAATRAMPIWLIAFTGNAVGGVGFPLAEMRRNGTFRRQFVATASASRFARCFCAAAMFVAHIHLYGFGAALMGRQLGAIFAWPMLMTSTVAWSQAWSHYLGEWTNAPPSAKAANAVSVALLVAAVGLAGGAAAVSN